MSKDYAKPFKSAAIKEFWEGIARQEFLGQECKTCHEKFFPPRARCPKCLGNQFIWYKLSGRGDLHSWTRMEFPVVNPYYIGIINLEEKIGRVIARLNFPNEPKIGDKVKMSFTTHKEDPFFEFIPQ